MRTGPILKAMIISQTVVKYFLSIRTKFLVCTGQSADTGGNRNQVHPLASPVPSVRGKGNRHHSTRVSRSHVVLDDGRSGKQAARFQELLQPPSHTYPTGRANAGSARVTTSS